MCLAASDRGLQRAEFVETETLAQTIDVGSGHPILDQALIEFQQYFGGGRQRFSVPMDQSGTEFQALVWSKLIEIEFGETRSYGQIAAAINMPTASRAVGLANGQNPLAIIVPCHRVVGANGKLTGYAGGLDRKRWLLDHESLQGGLFPD